MKTPEITIVNTFPLCTVPHEYVGRGSPLGDPWSHQASPDAVERYKDWLMAQLQDGNTVVIEELDRLAGQAMAEGKLTLRCYCHKPCTTIVIKELLLSVIPSTT